MAVLVMAAIIYGSLYPFAFHLTVDRASSLTHLLGTWANPPDSRGDLLANILLYSPLGFALGSATRALPARWSIAVVAVGAVLSFSIEWIQFYDETRVSCLSDFYLNVLGTLLGWFASRNSILNAVKVVLPEGGSAAFARVLLFAWLAWRLFPYVPTIDLHKYWHSLKPVLLTPNLSPYEFFRYTTLWLSVSYLFRLGVRPKREPLVLMAAIGGFFCAKILIVDQVLTLPEICGAGVALLLCPLLDRPPPTAVRGVAVLFAIAVIGSRLLPWELSEIAKPFEWMPFFSLLTGSLSVDLISFSEKFFLYGTLLLLLIKSGLPLGFATALECVALLATSALQTLLVERSAEITDAFMALLLAIFYALLRHERGEAGGQPAKRRPVNAP